MTQNHSLNKSPRTNDLIQSFKSSWLLPLISLALFSSFYVVKLLKQFKSINITEYKYVFSPEHGQLISRNFLAATVFLITLLATISTFGFFSSKKKLNVYLSLAVDRKTLFINRAFSNISLLFISYFVPLTIDLFVNIGKFGLSKELFGIFMFSLSGFSAIVLVAFAFGTIAVAITGSIVESVLVGVSLTFLPKMIISFVFNILDVFLYGKGTGSSSAFNKNDFSYLDPFSFFTRQNVSYDTSEVYGTLKFDSYFPTTATIKDFFIVFVWMGIGVALLFLANKLIRHKKVENVGILGANKSSNIIISTFVLFAVSLFTSIFLDYGKKISTQILTLCITIAIMTVAYIVTMIILTRNVKKTAFGAVAVPVYVVLIMSVCGVAMTGGFGFANRIPNQASVEKAYVSLPSATSFYNDLYDSNSLINMQVDYNSMMGPFESESDIKKIIELNGLVTAKDEEGTGRVDITYFLKDGSVFVRQYTMVKKDVQKQFFSLADTDYGKNYLNKIFLDDAIPVQSQFNSDAVDDMSIAFNKQVRISGVALLEDEKLLSKNKGAIGYDTGSATLVSNDGSIKVGLNERLTLDEYKKLKENIVADLQSMTYEQRYLNRVAPKATITFTEKSVEESKDYQIQKSDAFVALYPEMTKTISFLSEKMMIDEVKIKKPTKAYVVSNRSKVAAKQYAGTVNMIITHAVEYLKPFGGYFVNPKTGMKFVDEMFAITDEEMIGHDGTRSENVNSILEIVGVEKIRFFRDMFKNAQNITDTSQLEALSNACSPVGYAEGEVYYVLMEYDGFITMMILDETQAPGFINK